MLLEKNMRRLLIRFIFVLTALLMFSMGVWTDSYLRDIGENTYLACNTFKCNIVAVADNPMMFFEHPIETIKTIIYSD